jgi:hypothetical protein
MRIALSLSCATALALLSGAAISAEKTFELTEVTGKVLVTTRDGALPAELGQQIAEGTRIFVGSDSVARVSTADGVCNIALPPEKVTIVSYKNLCDVQITPTSSDPAPGGLPPPAVGLAFFGVAAGAAVWTLIDDDDDPVSAR